MTRSTVPGYLVAVAVVAASVLLRFALAPWLGLKVPYLHFFPAIIVAGWYGGFGPGIAATLLSTLAAMYFFLPPDGFAVGDPADVVSLPLFALTGLVIAWLNHRLRATEASQRVTADQSVARAERLDAVFNTAVDGIIVISDKGIIEAINHAAERLFGYPEAEAIGRNVNMFMPPPYHAEHDGYLQRYLATGSATIIGTGREVTGRHRDGHTFPLHLSVGEMMIGGERKFTGMLHDLSSRVQLEEQLRSSESRWRSVIGSAVDGIIDRVEGSIRRRNDRRNHPAGRRLILSDGLRAGYARLGSMVSADAVCGIFQRASIGGTASTSVDDRHSTR